MKEARRLRWHACRMAIASHATSHSPLASSSRLHRVRHACHLQRCLICTCLTHPRMLTHARALKHDEYLRRLILAGPSFYHEHAFPPWFLLQRSAIVREALDVVQEMAFYKVAQKNATQRLPRCNIVTRMHLARVDTGGRASVHPSTAVTYLHVNPMQGASHKILQPSTQNTRRIS